MEQETGQNLGEQLSLGKHKKEALKRQKQNPPSQRGGKHTRESMEDRALRRKKQFALSNQLG